MEGDPGATVDAILHLLATVGDTRYDESVTQVAHALQCADRAVADGATDELIAAALLHDIGHLLLIEQRRLGEPAAVDLHHEAVGARYLEPAFGPAVSRPVALHVRAKRYLCATDASYEPGLSPGSIRSLAMQGGPLDGRAVAAFERVPGWADAVRLRRWDDEAKILGATTTPVADHRSRLLALVLARG